MKIDFSDVAVETEPTAAERYLSNFSSEEIFDEWSFDTPEPDWWRKVTPEFKILYNDFGPMVLLTHKYRNYLL